jgi:WD40 repeat protein
MKTTKQYIIGRAQLLAERRANGLREARSFSTRFQMRKIAGAMALAWMVMIAPAWSQPLQTLKRPTKERVYCASFTPDGKLLAVGSSAPAAQTDRLPEGVIELYDLGTGKLTRTLRQSAWSEGFDTFNAVVDIAISPDGKSMLSSDKTGYALWDLRTGQLQKRWQDVGTGDFWISPAWSPDGSLLALTWLPSDFDAPRGLMVMEAATGKEVAFVPVEIGYIRTARFSPDGRLVATAGHDCVVRVFDLTTKREVFKDETGGTMFAAGFSPDGRELVAGPSSAGVLLYEVTVSDGKVTVRKKGQSSRTREETHRVEYLPDGKRAVSLSDVGLRIWDTSDWNKSVRKEGVLAWLSVDGTKMAVVTGESPGEIEVWRFEKFIKAF